MARTNGASSDAALEARTPDLESDYFKKIFPQGLQCEGGSPAPDANISNFIEAEIIPRLLLLHSTGPEDAPRPHSPTFQRCGPSDVALMTGLVLAMDGAAPRRFVEGLLKEGVEIHDILLNLLAPTARRLGEMWTADEADFLQVTSGVCELQRMLHMLTRPGSHPIVHNGPQALLLPAPEEQHSFGLLIVAEMFRSDGWTVSTNLAPGKVEIDRAVSATPFAIVGFSLSCETLIGPLTSAIGIVRSKSCNPETKIMVGGPAFDAVPGLYRKVGADLQATDASHALALARAVIADAGQ